MKKLYWIALMGITWLVIGCSGNTYSKLRNKEDRLIHNYIRRNNIHILHKLPENDVWDKKDYYKVPGYDDLYFHLDYRGDSVYIDSVSPTQIDTVDLTIKRNDIVVTRYKQFALTVDADTLSYWSTLDQAHPYEFYYAITSGVSDGYTEICESIGWHEAVRLMKYPESQCEIIVPSKQGFSVDETTVTPYVYIIKIVRVRQ